MKVNYPKPNFPKAFELCKKACPGVKKCNKNGLLFYNDYFYKCPLYETHQKITRIQKQLDQSIPEELKGVTMENYTPQTQTQQKLIETVGRYFEKKAWRNGKGLIICGPNGVGKTHVAVAIYKKLIGQHVTAAFARPKLDGGFHEIEEHYKMLAAPKVLIYDDFGPELERDFILNHLFNLFDKRVNSKKGLIGTTNLKSVALKYKFGTKIFSRLSKDNFFLQIDGEDFREKKRELF